MRRALLIGLDEYPDAPLNGCVQDAERMRDVLERNEDGSINFDCRVLECPPTIVSRASLRQAITELFSQPADIAWLHFSGHGTANDLGGYLVTPDFEANDVGVPMMDVLTMANNADISETIITLDCCNSGAFGQIPATNANNLNLSDGIAVITATRASEPSLEVGGGGIFSSLLVEALEGGAAGIQGEVTIAGIYAFIDSALGPWDQRPLFKANISRLVQLRKGKEKVSQDLLRRIVELFPLPAEDLPLDPSYEPSVEPRHAQHEDDFRALQLLRAGGLVEPVNEEHMFYASVNSDACRLTSSGLYYWRLVNDGRI